MGCSTSGNQPPPSMRHPALPRHCLVQVHPADPTPYTPARRYIPLPDALARRCIVERALGPGSSVKASLSPADLDKIVARTDGYSGWVGQLLLLLLPRLLLLLLAWTKSWRGRTATRVGWVDGWGCRCCCDWWWGPWAGLGSGEH